MKDRRARLAALVACAALVLLGDLVLSHLTSLSDHERKNLHDTVIMNGAVFWAPVMTCVSATAIAVFYIPRLDWKNMRRWPPEDFLLGVPFFTLFCAVVSLAHVKEAYMSHLVALHASSGEWTGELAIICAGAVSLIPFLLFALSLKPAAKKLHVALVATGLAIASVFCFFIVFFIVPPVSFFAAMIIFDDSIHIRFSGPPGF
jgi:hypothetical protein